MAWYFPQSHLFLLLLVLWIRGNVSFVLESAESLLLTSLSNMGRNAEAEGRRRKLKEMRRKIFLLYSTSPSSLFLNIFSYDDDMENCVVGWGCSGVFLHKIFVSFSPRKSWKSERVWQWHFRQLKRFHFIARMNFMKSSPILLFLLAFFTRHSSLDENYLSFFTALLFRKGEKAQKATQRFKC